MFSRTCHLLFLAVALVAGFFIPSYAQDTVPKETGVMFSRCGYTVHSSYASLTSQNGMNVADASGCSQMSYFQSYRFINVSVEVTFSDHTRSDGVLTADYCGYEQHVCEGGGYHNTPVTRYVRASMPFSSPVCPVGYPIDNGDGTCSVDGAHEAFCEDVAAGGNDTSYWLDDTEAVSSVHCVNFGTYSCVYNKAEIGIGLGNAPVRYQYSASGETCTDGADGASPGDGTGVPVSDPLDGTDLGDPGMGNSPDDLTLDTCTQAEIDDGSCQSKIANNSAHYLGGVFEYETRKATTELLDALALSVNKLNDNADKNMNYVVDALTDFAALNSAGLKEISDKTGGGGGVVGGDPAGWQTQENVTLDGLQCDPDPVTGECTDWTPLGSRTLPEKIINLNNAADEFEQFEAEGECPASIDMALTFGNFGFNSSPICQVLTGVKFLVLLIAYYFVARMIHRGVAS